MSSERTLYSISTFSAKKIVKRQAAAWLHAPGTRGRFTNRARNQAEGGEKEETLIGPIYSEGALIGGADEQDRAADGGKEARDRRNRLYPGRLPARKGETLKPLGKRRLKRGGQPGHQNFQILNYRSETRKKEVFISW